MTAGWWRHKKGRGHLMQSAVTIRDRLMSRCGRFIIRKPDRELPLLLPDGWIPCKDCQKLLEGDDVKTLSDSTPAS